MEVTGKVRHVGPVQQVRDSFRKRELVVTTEEQYPQHIMIEFTQDKVDLLNQYKPGDDVKVSINLRGREWVNPQGETKYFNSIQGWRIERMDAQAQQYGGAPQYQQQQPQQQYQQQPQYQAPTQQFPPAPQQFSQDEPDDLPF
jgi:single-stranded DNA-binding protein